MAERAVLFGAGLGGGLGTETRETGDIVRRAVQADRDGLDLVTIADHPYLGDRLDAYAATGFLLGHTENIAAAVTVTSPARPAPVLARTIASLSSLSGGRIIFGVGAGGTWDLIAKLGIAPLAPGAAVRAMEETITLVRALSGGGGPVTFAGEFYQVTELDPAPAPAPPVWTGSVGPKSLAVTGRLADGWVPPRGADWLSPQYRAGRALIDEAAAAAGRDGTGIIDVFNFGGVITQSPQSLARDENGRWTGGSVRQWIEEITGAVLEHGAGGFIYRETGATPSETALRQWAQEIVPAVREAIATA